MNERSFMGNTDKKRKSDSRLRACITIDGKKYWVQGYSKRELEQKKIDKRIEVELARDSLENKRKGNYLVKEWSKEWLEIYKKPKVNPRHLKDIEGELNKWILPVIGNKKLKDVTQSDIQTIMNNLKGHSSSHIKKVFDTVKGMLRQAYNNRYLEDMRIVSGVTMPTAKKVQKRRAITDEERATIVAVAKTFNGGIFYLIMLYAGLRPSEVAALRWKHIDFERGEIHVRDALKSDDTISDDKESDNGKTVNATRDVFLASELEAALIELMERENPGENDFIAHKRRSKEHHTKTSMRTMWESFRLAMHIYLGGETDRSIRKYMHTDKDDEGKEMVSQNVKYTVEIPIDDKVAKDLVPYDLRHTFCTDLRARGIPIEEAKDLMGHSDISLTARIYSHPTKSSIENAKQLYDNYKQSGQKTTVRTNVNNCQIDP